MASAKKGKKNKGKTLALSDFLQETPGTVATVPIRKSSTNWADEVEDNHDVYDPRAAKASVVLPTAPKASRDFDDIIDKVPQDPPYMAYLTNLPYDVDENEISYFFRNMKIANMRIPKDDRAGDVPRLKGFGYVEFEDRESLLNALVIPDTTIKNRRIRIEVSTDYGNDNRRGGRMDMNRDRGNRGEGASLGDWRSGPRQDNSDNMERRTFSRDRDRDRDRDASDSSSMWRDSERRQPAPRDSDRPFTRSSNDRYRSDRDDSEYGRSRDDKFLSSRRFDSDRDRDRRNGGGFTRGGDGFGRGGDGFGRSGDGFGRGGDDSNRKERDEPRQRPKLLLTPRTKPVEAEAGKTSSSTSIFGNAKPVDTAARERQIEERLAKDHDVAPRREVSRERMEVEREKEKEKKEEVVEEEKEKEEVVVHSPPNQKSDVNGVVEKAQVHHPPPKKETREKPDNERQHKSDVRKKDEKKEKTEKEMPKLKKTEPPNFVASNKFAFLQNEDSSD